MKILTFIGKNLEECREILINRDDVLSYEIMPNSTPYSTSSDDENWLYDMIIEVR